MSEQAWIDIKSLSSCPYCLGALPLQLLELYVIFFLTRRWMKANSGKCDRIDRWMLLISAICISVDLLGWLVTENIINSFSILLKIPWSLSLLLVYLRFLFRREVTAQIFVWLCLLIMAWWAIAWLFWQQIPVKLPLLLIDCIFIGCSLNQYLRITQLLDNEQERQKELKTNLKETEIQLLQRREYEHKVLSPQFRYHLYLRRSFCFWMTINIIVNYLILWDLQLSSSLMGKDLVVFLLQLLPILQYYFFACANHWLATA